jgi:integrase
MKLTSKNIAELKLPVGSKDAVWWDDEISGFGIRIREGGSRTWIYRYRSGSKQRSYILGSAKSVPLIVARKNASTLEARVRIGEDPALEKQTARLEAEHTFEALAGQYLEKRQKEWRPKSYSEYNRHLMSYAKPLHRFPITTVSQRNIANLLNSIAEESGVVTSNRVRATLSALFSWILGEGIRLPEGNVVSYTNKHKETPRDRVLSDAEIRAIWKACLNNGFGAIVKLLLLTGQRKSEIGSLQWKEVHHEQIVLPAERTKNRRTHILPLSDPVKAILDQFRDTGRVYVFGRYDTGFQGWHIAKDELDARTSPLLPAWTLHDLRRTAATRMADLGVQPHIIEAVLNHASGHKGGVAGIYNRATYDKEKREALALWAEHVMALVEGRKAVVVPMRRA